MNIRAADEARTLLAELGIAAEILAARDLRPQREAGQLVFAGLGSDGRDKFLTAATARAWHQMRDAAAQQDVTLLLISGFRSLSFQAALIRAKLARGLSIEEVLRINAPPGYSEHHTGRAIDIGSPDCAALDEAFEQTTAFAWLTQHAMRFGFAMSYPRDNREGFLYEPWHWCHRPRRHPAAP